MTRLQFGEAVWLLTGTVSTVMSTKETLKYVTKVAFSTFGHDPEVMHEGE
jgi:hypothetical protein